MIQRVQTLFLLGTMALLGVLETKILPFASLLHGVTPNDVRHAEYNDGNYTISDNSGLLILSAAIILVLGAAIFLYNNRKRQITIVTLGNVLIGILTVLTAYLPKAAASHLLTEPNGTLPDIQMNYLGYADLIAALALSSLAVYFIRKDEKLVRSADRLR